MPTTKERITIALTQEDIRELEHLSKIFGETKSSVIKRGIILLYAHTFQSTALKDFYETDA